MTVRETVNATKERFGTADLVKIVLGPTGNLRAPSIKKGKTWIVGFNEELYGEHF